MKRTYICHIIQLKQAFLVINNIKRQRMIDVELEGAEAMETSDSESSLTIHDLPPEVMHLIFSFCDASHLFECVQYVCKRWHQLLQAVHVWKGRKLVYGRDMPCHQLMNHIRCAPNIDAISFTYTSCHRFVPCLLSHCVNLSWLKLHGDFHVPYGALKNLVNLQYLDLDLRWKFEKRNNHDRNLTGISTITSLKTLIVRNFIYHERFVIECLKNSPNLKHIYMSKIDFFETYMDPENVVESSKDLQTVYVYGAQNVGKELLKLLAKPQYRNLSNLVIKPNEYSDKDLNNFLFHSKFPEMVTLDIGYSSDVTDKSMSSLVDSCPNLINLCLSRCSISDESLRMFLQKLSSLERLNLHGTLVSSELFQYFPSSFPKLKALNVCACRFVHQYHVLPLLHAIPNIMILDRRGDFVGGTGNFTSKWPFLPVRNALA